MGVTGIKPALQLKIEVFYLAIRNFNRCGRVQSSQCCHAPAWAP